MKSVILSSSGQLNFIGRFQETFKTVEQDSGFHDHHRRGRLAHLAGLSIARHRQILMFNG